MSNQKRSLHSLSYLTLLALFIAVELVMKVMGLGSVPIGPLNMSFLTVPVAVGAMLLGPMAGLIMGTVFGLASLWDAFSGASAMTGFFLNNVSVFHTVVLCVVTRALMGWLTGLVFQGVKKLDKTNTICYFAGAFAAPFLNTLLFMGYIVAAFYHTKFVQKLVSSTGAQNAFMFVVLLVGVQFLAEVGVCTLVGGGVAKGVAKATRRS